MSTCVQRASPDPGPWWRRCARRSTFSPGARCRHSRIRSSRWRASEVDDAYLRLQAYHISFRPTRPTLQYGNEGPIQRAVHGLAHVGHDLMFTANGESPTVPRRWAMPEPKGPMLNDIERAPYHAAFEESGAASPSSPKAPSSCWLAPRRPYVRADESGPPRGPRRRGPKAPGRNWDVSRFKRLKVPLIPSPHTGAGTA